MTDMQAEAGAVNGHAPAYVKFGPGPTDEMPLPWAEAGLIWLKSQRPAVFADMMLAVLGVERKRAKT